MISDLKDKLNKENAKFVLMLIGVLAFIVVPIVVPFIIVVELFLNAFSFLIAIVYSIFWIVFSWKVIMRWGDC